MTVPPMPTPMPVPTPMLTPCQVLQNRGGWTEDQALHRCTFPIGPRNTWSNLTYAVVGVFLALHYRTSAALAMGVALTILAVGSGLYHGLKTKWSNTLDWVGMYMAFGALVVHAVVPLSPSAPWLMLAFGGTVAGYFAYALNGVDLNGQMGVFLFLALLPAVFGPTPHRMEAAGAFATFLAAYGIWTLDTAHESVVGLWGHAVWHLLTAVAIGWTFTLGGF